MISGVTGRSAAQPLTSIYSSARIESQALTKPDVSEGKVELSTLSAQLADSVSRAEVRDSTLSREELCLEHSRLIRQLCGENYDGKRADTSDPDLIERARRATEYVMRSDQHVRNLKSPFSELSREQLTLITYDEGGAYTTDERRAALRGISDIEGQWNRRVIRLGDMEVAAGLANQPKFCAEIIAHYRTLPPIEQAVYPDNYEARLQARINEPPQDTATKDDPLITLFELLMRIYQSQKIGELDENPAEPQVAPEIRMVNDWAIALMKNS